MKTYFYRIEALTNLHAGSGDANYGVVDNLIQRDVVTELPVIHGSSLKGAIKEHFESIWQNSNDRINYIFGSNDNSGNYKFLPALLIAMPVRSNKLPYFMATSPAALHEFITMNSELGNNLDIDILTDLNKLSEETFSSEKPKILTQLSGLAIEDFESFDELSIVLNEKTKTLLGICCNNFVLLDDTNFKRITNNSNLPVIARNQLKDGQSKNLWYEQVVPRKSIFWTSLIVPESEQHFVDFEKGLGTPVHIGANASVGYGFTKISRILIL